MTEKEYEELLDSMRKQTEEICKTKESARKWLVDLGVNKEDGSLHPNYGGEE